mgnify:FL=1
MAIIDIFADTYVENEKSVAVPESGVKIMWTSKGEIRTVIRGGKAYGPEGRAR